MCDMSSPSTASQKKSEDAWRAEDDHRTLSRAAEVQADPARMKGAAKHHQKVTRGLSKVGRMIGGKR